ncbi:MAG: efflux RND transporter periplasmic adaptor subunit [candidate division Zixibacteria bacterium]|nr:efflux RND transporter periplasmic adaptor subunit [candidate division Zixibacteria bacterium]
MNKISVIALLTLIMSMIITACGGKDDAYQEEKAIPVEVADVEYKEFVVPVHTSGRLSVGKEMRLSFKTGGVIEAFRVDEGERVRKGQILASLKLDEVKAQAEMAESSLDKAERDLKRIRDLYADSVATLEQLQNAETALQVARSKAEIARFNLEHSVIKAPADGIVLKQLLEVNELVGAGTPVLYVGTTEDAWTVDTGVPDGDVVRLRLGDSAQVIFDAHPSTPVEAKVTEIAESPDPITGTYEVKLSLEPTKNKLLSGFSAKVTIYPEPESPQYFVPIDALIQANGYGASVFAIDSSNRAKRVDVQVEKLLGDHVAISKGLEGTERVITLGASYVAEGSPVAIKKLSTSTGAR